MKVILVNEQKELFFSQVPLPQISSAQVLIETHYAALNRADLMQRAGDYPPPEGAPEWMGLEISGIVCKIGDTAKKNSGLAVGDRVCALLGGGGYAEYAAVDYPMVMKVPDCLSLAQASAIPEGYATAYLNLFTEGKLQKNETVLVHAGASGVGIAVQQIAKAYGAKVFATVRSDEKALKIKKFGADQIINSQTTNMITFFEQHPVDLVIDCVGGNLMGQCFEKLNRYGRWIMIAALGGDLTQINLKQVYKKGLRLIGSTLRSRPNEIKAQILNSLQSEIFPYFENESIRPEIFQILNWENAEEAHRLMQKNQTTGKIILKIKA